MPNEDALRIASQVFSVTTAPAQDERVKASKGLRDALVATAGTFMDPGRHSRDDQMPGESIAKLFLGRIGGDPMKPLNATVSVGESGLVAVAITGVSGHHYIPFEHFQLRWDPRTKNWVTDETDDTVVQQHGAPATLLSAEGLIWRRIREMVAKVLATTQRKP